MTDLTAYFVFRVEYRREIRCLQGWIFEAARGESYFHLEAVLFGRKKEKKNERKMGGRILITFNSCRCEWKLRVKRKCLYSTDTAFTLHKHGKYFLQTKGQKRGDEAIIERHVKFRADLQQIRGARDSTTISIG